MEGISLYLPRMDLLYLVNTLLPSSQSLLLIWEYGNKLSAMWSFVASIFTLHTVWLALRQYTRPWYTHILIAQCSSIVAELWKLVQKDFWNQTNHWNCIFLPKGKRLQVIQSLHVFLLHLCRWLIEMVQQKEIKCHKWKNGIKTRISHTIMISEVYPLGLRSSKGDAPLCIRIRWFGEQQLENPNNMPVLNLMRIPSEITYSLRFGI